MPTVRATARLTVATGAAALIATVLVVVRSGLTSGADVLVPRRLLRVLASRVALAFGALRTTRSHEPFGVGGRRVGDHVDLVEQRRVVAGAAGDAVDLAVARVERVVAVAAVERVADLVDGAAGPGCTSPRASAHRLSLPSPPVETSWPRLAKIVSLPAPPSCVSLPVPPAMRSLPFSP